MRQATLCFLIKENKVLLAMKKRGFGVGKWNGVGGKVSEGETIERAAIRETKEEIDVSILEEHLKSFGYLDFYFPHKKEWNQRVHIFIAKNWVGEPTESEEMKPQWFEQGSIPFEQTWCDDKHWLPIVLRGNKIEGHFNFTPEGNDFDSYKINLV